ncbi:MAG TPA: hypothetical protein VFA18_07480 [Gemmataceae bacterium]|nr:hypothetical protein [Gemmataceae bacterium]
MTRKMMLCTAAGLVLVAGAAAGYWYWAWYDPGPDRTELIKKFIQVGHPRPDSIVVERCRHAHASAITKVQQTYPTFEVVNCTYRYQDALGQDLEATQQYYILDDQVIHAEGMPFEAVHGREAPANLEKWLTVMIFGKKDPKAAAVMKADLGKQSGATGRRNMGGMPGPPRGGRAGSGNQGSRPANAQAAPTPSKDAKAGAPTTPAPGEHK